MKKLILLLLILFCTIIFSSCTLKRKIKNEFYSQETLQRYELDELPKGNWKDCVVWGSSFYFNTGKKDFEEWIISIVDYIDKREDITCWGFADEFENSGSRDYPVTLYEDSTDYLKDNDWLSIAFTTMPLQDNTFQNCYYINAIDHQGDATLRVEGSDYSYLYYMNLQNRSSYAERYHIV